MTLSTVFADDFEECYPHGVFFDNRVRADQIKITTFNAEWLYIKDLSKVTSRFRKPAHAKDHLEEIVTIISELNSDILFLNEVEDCTILNRLANQYTALKTGNGNYQPYILNQADSGLNIGMLSRVRPMGIGVVKTPHDCVHCPHAPERNLWAQFEISNFQRFRVFGMHLKAKTEQNDFNDKRDKQVNAMMQDIGHAYEAGFEVVVLGDMNTERPAFESVQWLGSAAISPLVSQSGQTVVLRKYTHHFGQYDHIFLSRGLYDHVAQMKFGTESFTSPPGKEGRAQRKWGDRKSDHIPVSVVIQSSPHDAHAHAISGVSGYVIGYDIALPVTPTKKRQKTNYQGDFQVHEDFQVYEDRSDTRANYPIRNNGHRQDQRSSQNPQTKVFQVFPSGDENIAPRFQNNEGRNDNQQVFRNNDHRQGHRFIPQNKVPLGNYGFSSGRNDNQQLFRNNDHRQGQRVFQKLQNKVGSKPKNSKRQYGSMNSRQDQRSSQNPQTKVFQVFPSGDENIAPRFQNNEGRNDNQQVFRNNDHRQGHRFIPQNKVPLGNYGFSSGRNDNQQLFRNNDHRQGQRVFQKLQNKVGSKPKNSKRQYGSMNSRQFNNQDMKKMITT